MWGAASAVLRSIGDGIFHSPRETLLNSLLILSNLSSMALHGFSVTGDFEQSFANGQSIAFHSGFSLRLEASYFHCLLLLLAVFSIIFVSFSCLRAVYNTLLFRYGCYANSFTRLPLSARGGYPKRVVFHFQWLHIRVPPCCGFPFSRLTGFPPHSTHDNNDLAVRYVSHINV